MVRSMTGYGRAQKTTASGTTIVEIRSLNHKFYDVSLRLPESISVLEEKIKVAIKNSVKRGKLTLSVTFKPSETLLSRSIKCDTASVKRVHNILKKVKKELNIKGDIELSDVLSLAPNPICYEKAPINPARLWSTLRLTVDAALKELMAMRIKEGRALARDILSNAMLIKSKVKAIEKRSALVAKNYKKKLLKKFGELGGVKKLKIDNARIESECAILARNSDISEELVRLHSHVKGLKELLSRDTEAGRQIDFMAQEMMREINTICQKAGDYLISKEGILIKSAIEKIREQAQNVE